MALAQNISRIRLNSEIDVEMYFVPKFLAMLGYNCPRDVQNRPALESPDYYVGTRKKRAIYPDHLVSSNGHVAFILEVKSPANELGPSEIGQALSYALHPNVQAAICVLTNGRRTLVVHSRMHEPVFVVTQRGIPTRLVELQLLLGRKSMAHQVGELVVDKKLGTGGFGTVYHALNLTLNRPEAVKIYHPKVVASMKRRLIQGLRAQAKLHHESVPTIYHIHDQRGELAASMQYSDGIALDRWIKRSKPTPQRKIKVLAQVARAVHAAHSGGVVHRDLKPSNVLIEKAGKSWKPLIVDFDTAAATDSTKLTRTAEAIGTLGFMAPEMYSARRSAGDKRSPYVDIYSLGVLTYFSFFGKTPLAGHFDSARMANLIKRVPELKRNQVVHLMRVIDKSMDLEPKARYATAGIFADALEESLSKSPSMHWEAEADFIAALFQEVDQRTATSPIHHLNLKLYDDNNQLGRFAVIAGTGEALIMYDFDHRELMAGLSFPRSRDFYSFLKRPVYGALRKAFGRALTTDEPNPRENGGVYIFWRLSEIMDSSPGAVAEKGIATLRKFCLLLGDKSSSGGSEIGTERTAVRRSSSR